LLVSIRSGAYPFAGRRMMTAAGSQIKRPTHDVESPTCWSHTTLAHSRGPAQVAAQAKLVERLARHLARIKREK
jgi:hypothetical protein